MYCMYVMWYTQIHTNTYIYMHIHTYTCIYTRYIHTDIHTIHTIHTDTNVYIHIHTHTYTRQSGSGGVFVRQWRLHATPLHSATYPDHLRRGSGRARRARNACGLPIGWAGGALWIPQRVLRAPVRQNGSGGGSPMAGKSGRPPAQGCPEWGPRGAAPAGGLLGTLCWHPCLSGQIHTIQKDTYTIHTIHTHMHSVLASANTYHTYSIHAHTYNTYNTCTYGLKYVNRNTYKIHTRYIRYIHICIDPKVRNHFCKLYVCACIWMHMCMYDVCISVHMSMYLYVLYVSCMYIAPNNFGCKKYIQYAQHMHDMHKICTKYESTYIQYIHIHTTYGLTPLLYVYVCCMYCKSIHTHISLIHTKYIRAKFCMYLHVWHVSACICLYLHVWT